MYVSVCVPPKCPVSAEIRWWQQIHCNWIYEWLSVTMWVLGTQPGFSARAVKCS